MADSAILFAIDNTQDYNVVAQTYCNRIVVQENYNSATPPTADLLQRIPATAASAVNIPKGTAAIYTPNPGTSSPGVFVVQENYNFRFKPGQVVGTIRTVLGSITVQQIESQQV